MLAFLSGQAEEITIKHNGLTLNANLTMAEGNHFSAGMVLVMHGVLGHNRMEVVEAAQQALLDIGFSSLAMNLSLSIDNRHGFLDCDVDHQHIQDDVLDEVGAWIDYLNSQGANRIVLMGHGFGANQILAYVQDRPDPIITHLIFLAPNTTSTFGDAHLRRYGQSADATLNKAKQLIEEGRGHELMANTDFLFCPRAQVSPNSFVSYYSVEKVEQYFDFPRFLSSTDIPSLVTTGAADERQPQVAKQIFPYVDGKKIQLTVIEDAGHFFHDFNIDKAMKSVVDFLAEAR